MYSNSFSVLRILGGGRAKAVGMFLLSFFAILACGCSGQKESEVAARATLGETLRYEQEIDGKIAAENSFYKQENDVLTEAAKNLTTVSVLNVENRTMAELVATVKADKGNTQGLALSDFATKLVRGVRAKKTQAAKFSTEVAQGARSLQSLELQKAGLTAVRNDLEQLQAGPSNKQQLQSWIDFGKEVQKEVRGTGSNGSKSDNGVDASAKSGNPP
jgi:hypothetical protein